MAKPKNIEHIEPKTDVPQAPVQPVVSEAPKNLELRVGAKVEFEMYPMNHVRRIVSKPDGTFTQVTIKNTTGVVQDIRKEDYTMNGQAVYTVIIMAEDAEGTVRTFHKLNTEVKVLG